MSREQKPHKRVEIRMDWNIYDRLEQYCELRHCTKTDAIEEALNRFLFIELTGGFRDMPTK